MWAIVFVLFLIVDNHFLLGKENSCFQSFCFLTGKRKDEMFCEKIKGRKTDFQLNNVKFVRPELNRSSTNENTTYLH